MRNAYVDDESLFVHYHPCSFLEYFGSEHCYGNDIRLKLRTCLTQKMVNKYVACKLVWPDQDWVEKVKEFANTLEAHTLKAPFTTAYGFLGQSQPRGEVANVAVQVISSASEREDDAVSVHGEEGKPASSSGESCMMVPPESPLATTPRDDLWDTQPAPLEPKSSDDSARTVPLPQNRSPETRSGDDVDIPSNNDHNQTSQVLPSIEAEPLEKIDDEMDVDDDI